MPTARSRRTRRWPGSRRMSRGSKRSGGKEEPRPPEPPPPCPPPPETPPPPRRRPAVPVLDERPADRHPTGQHQRPGLGPGLHVRARGPPRVVDLIVVDRDLG